MNETKSLEPKLASTVYREYNDGYFKTLISPAQTSGNFALLEMKLPMGAEPPLHVHDKEDETFYVLDGMANFYIGDKIVTVGPGQAIFAPRMVAHRFRIMSRQLHFVTLLTPGACWEDFMEVSTACDTEPVMKAPAGPPLLGVLMHLAERLTAHYGVMQVGN